MERGGRQQEEAVPSALILTCRLLADCGPHRGGDRRLRARPERAIDAGNLPLAVAAVADLRKLGANVDDALRRHRGRVLRSARRA